MRPSDLQPVLDALPLPALLITESERVEAANAAGVELFGGPVLATHYVSVLRQPELVDCVAGTLKDASARRARFFVNTESADSEYEVHCTALEGVTPRMVLVSFEDVSHVVKAGRQRRDFVANVSHELRTPLTSLMGFIETLRGPAKDDLAAHARFLEIMANEASRMERLVSDLLSLSRVESQERQRPREDVDLAMLIKSVAGSLEPTAQEAGVSVRCEVPDAPVTVPGDADQLRQVVSNLVENALKYGSAGKVVTVALSGPEHIPSMRGPGVSLTVRDEGQGIDPLHIPRLTERFYRVDSHRSRQVGGTGLGLAIVKHIVSRHRGRLRIESELGTGSTFKVLLPATD